ncbi:MAG: O-acetyl-ADP-ribose deacetylase [Nitrospirota bacterium]
MAEISLIKGDITKVHADAIVNAANSTLLGGGGVDGAIHQAAGPGLLRECKKIGGCPTGEARITGGYNLPAKFVIHTVGPVWKRPSTGIGGGGESVPREDALLASCYRNSLALAEENGIRTIAFPSISTGAYRFPVERASNIAVREIREFLKAHPNMEKVIIVCFGDEVLHAYEQALK